TFEALVDTGASYSWVPRDILGRLGVQRSFGREFQTADGRVIVRDMAEARARLEGDELPTLVVFGDPGSLPLLGAYTLEGFGLGVQRPGLLPEEQRGHSAGARAHAWLRHGWEHAGQPPGPPPRPVQRHLR